MQFNAQTIIIILLNIAINIFTIYIIRRNSELRKRNDTLEAWTANLKDEKRELREKLSHFEIENDNLYFKMEKLRSDNEILKAENVSLYETEKEKLNLKERLDKLTNSIENTLHILNTYVLKKL